MSQKLCGIPKKVIQRYFYRFQVPLGYRDLGKLVDICSKPEVDIKQFPRRYTPYALIQTKRAFEECRKNEGIVSKPAIQAEANLVDVAAEMGDATAISLLCGARMMQHTVSDADMESGGKLLKQLMDSKFPLAFKVSGDIAYTLGHSNEALKLYELAIENGLEDAKLVIECYRNIGHIAFKQANLMKARDAFSFACQLAGNSKQVSDCHYFLGQLREPDRVAARMHFEVAASFGLRDAFLPLASLLLSWFNEARLAKEWFKMAESTDSSGAALLGMLDCSIQLYENDEAVKILDKIKRRPDSDEILAHRRQAVRNLLQTKEATQDARTGSAQRWDL